MEPEISLLCKDLVKTYPGVIAMDHINFELRKGEVHALLGENGAGKSTLIKSIAGAHQCDSGTITIDGKEFHSLTPLQAKEMGVEVVYQEFNQMPSLSVAENIYLTELRGKRIVAARPSAPLLQRNQHRRRRFIVCNRLRHEPDARTRLGQIGRKLRVLRNRHAAPPARLLQHRPVHGKARSDKLR